MFTDEQIREAAKSAYSIRGVMVNLGLNGNGNQHKIFARKIQELNLTFQVKPSPVGMKGRPLNDYLVLNGPIIATSKLRKKLVKLKLLNEICSECKLGPIWNNKPLVLQLDHIDGNRKNNCINNLRLLCPNCHTQTETYGAANIKKRDNLRTAHKRQLISPKHNSCNCGKKIRRNNKLCRNCFLESRKTNIHKYPQLVEMVNRLSYKQISKKLGISDKTVSKYCKMLRTTAK